MSQIDSAPGIEEQYSSATNTSNLRVTADKRGAADVLMASGMSNSRIGGALMRLRTEYTSAGVPRASAGETDYRLMMGKLHSFAGVVDAVTAQAKQWRIDRPEAVALAVIAHWLDDICRHCEGRGKERIKDTPTLSGKNCKHCQGTGHTALPHGSDGRRMEGFIADCVNRWRRQTSQRLHGMR